MACSSANNWRNVFAINVPREEEELELDGTWFGVYNISRTGEYFCKSAWNVSPFNRRIVRATSSSEESTFPVESPFTLAEAFPEGESCKRK